MQIKNIKAKDELNAHGANAELALEALDPKAVDTDDAVSDIEDKGAN